MRPEILAPWLLSIGLAAVIFVFLRERKALDRRVRYLTDCLIEENRMRLVAEASPDKPKDRPLSDRLETKDKAELKSRREAWGDFVEATELLMQVDEEWEDRV